MMHRAAFLGSSIAAFSVAAVAPALATGGLDVDDRDELRSDDEPARRPAKAAGAMSVSGAVVRVLVPDDRSRRYRGTLANGPRGAFVNSLGIEEYLLGVVPSEMPSGWEPAALEAQAIVARTYALRKRRPTSPYDLVSNVGDQMYGGMNVERWSASLAASRTAGAVVLYDGALADVAYMSCCGGHTEDAARIWNTPEPYLRGVADPYCAGARNRDWTAAASWLRLARSLRLDSQSVPVKLELLDAGICGRPRDLRFVGDRSSVDVATVALRRALAGRLPSTYIRSGVIRRGEDEEDPQIVLTGSGRGHGVGLCQWGAQGLAAAGATAAQIVGFYFPGTTVGRPATVARVPRSKRRVAVGA